MSISDISEKEKQELYAWARKFNLNEAAMNTLLEQSLQDGNLDYLHDQMEKFEAWCKVDPGIINDRVMRARILRPIPNFPTGYEKNNLLSKEN